MLLKPGLYSLAGTRSVPHHPALLGGRCTCGHVFFPMHDYGCERCGRHGHAVSKQDLSGRGTLLAAAVVHIHGDKTRAVPFMIGKIALDDGPVVRTLIAGNRSGMIPGQQMVTTIICVGKPEDGQPIQDLRFISLRKEITQKG